jgi:hypothetical protein
LAPWCSSDQYYEQDIMLGNLTATRTEAFDQQPALPAEIASVELFDEMAAKVVENVPPGHGGTVGGPSY